MQKTEKTQETRSFSAEAQEASAIAAGKTIEDKMMGCMFVKGKEFCAVVLVLIACL